MPTLRIEPYELNTVYLHTHSIFILELSLSLREKLFFSSTDSFFFDELEPWNLVNLILGGYCQ